mgnify:CR=1 FL=1
METITEAANENNVIEDTDALIIAEDIEKFYGFGRNALHVLKGVTLSINKGEIVSIVGPSGAGKSTLLNLIGCIDTFQRGSLTINDHDISNITVESLSGFRNKNIGFIFQLHNLLQEFTALENVMMPLLIRRVGKSNARKQAEELLARFNLSDRLSHKPAEMSGGECQRIAVARAIIGKPSIILADEPTGSLDTENSQNLTNILFELARENNITIVLVTHDRDIANMTERRISLVDGVIKGDEKLSHS